MASIIKAHEHARVNPPGAFQLDELTGEAIAPGGSAASRAAGVLSRAQQQACEIRKRAEEEGRSAGLLVAEQVLSERIDRQATASMAAIEEAVARVREARDQWLAHWERSAVHVAIKIAERVIRREVAHTPEITMSLVREALELAAGSADVKLCFHPDDAKALGQHAERLAKQLTPLGRVELVPDATIEPGGCRVDTRFGKVDQQFASQLALIENELTR